MIKKLRKACVLITALTMFALSLTACGDTTGAAGDAAQTADAATESNTDTAANISTDVPAADAAAETAVVTQDAYFEENNISFTDERTFTVPFAADTYDPESLEYKEYKGVTVEPEDKAVITLGELKPAKCDKDGYKAFTLDYTVTGDIRVTVDTYDYDENYSYEPQFPHVDIADYYTGTLLTYYPSLERTEEGYDYIDTLTFNNKSYEIAYYNLEKYGDYVEGDWRIDENADDSRMQWYDVTVSEEHTIEIRVPESYDGLVFAVNLNGIKEYDKGAFFEYMGNKKRLIYEEDPNGYTYSPDASAFIRASDY